MHSKLVMLFDECDNKDDEYYNAIEQLSSEHSNASSQTIKQHSVFPAKKDEHHAASMMEIENKHSYNGSKGYRALCCS